MGTSTDPRLVSEPSSRAPTFATGQAEVPSLRLSYTQVLPMWLAGLEAWLRVNRNLITYASCPIISRLREGAVNHIVTVPEMVNLSATVISRPRLGSGGSIGFPRNLRVSQDR